jgi:hypothetical protein
LPLTSVNQSQLYGFNYLATNRIKSNPTNIDALAKHAALLTIPAHTSNGDTVLASAEE